MIGYQRTHSNKKNKVDAVIKNLSKSLDTLNLKPLIAKLNLSGWDSNTNNQYQSTTIGDNFSDWESIISR